LNGKKQQILDAALKLFVENGFHGTSTAEIAKTAGVATGTLFHHFKTKQELINSLYLHTKDQMLIAISIDYEESEQFKSNLKKLWLKFIQFGIENSDMFQFIIIFHSSPYISSLTKEQAETRFDDILIFYKKGIKHHDIKTVKDEMMLEYFWGTIFSTVSYFTKHPKRLNDENMNIAFELFWDGISI
jgi:AcrR family transcriptional regulator